MSGKIFSSNYDEKVSQFILGFQNITLLMHKYQSQLSLNNISASILSFTGKILLCLI